VTGPMGESGVGHKSGVWIMPLSKIDSAIAAQKKIPSGAGFAPNRTP
jgi:hypothetical protein